VTSLSSGRERSRRFSRGWGSRRSASVGLTANTAIPMDAGRLSRFTPVATSRRHSCGRSRRTSAFQWKNSSPGDEHMPAFRRGYGTSRFVLANRDSSGVKGSKTVQRSRTLCYRATRFSTIFCNPLTTRSSRGLMSGSKRLPSSSCMPLMYRAAMTRRCSSVYPFSPSENSRANSLE